MVVCYCASHGCGLLEDGAKMDPKTFKAHQLADKAAAARARIALDRQIISAEQEEIAAYVAGMSLSGDVSGSTIDGGRAWSQRTADMSDILKLRNFFGLSNEGSTTDPPPPPPPPPPPISTPPLRPESFSPSEQHRQPSNRELERKLMDNLSELRQEAEKLRKSIEWTFRPGQMVDRKGIGIHRKSIRRLYSATEKMIHDARLKPPSVISMKDAIMSDLDEATATLNVAASAPTPPANAASCSTGKSTFLVLLPFQVC